MSLKQHHNDSQTHAQTSKWTQRTTRGGQWSFPLPTEAGTCVHHNQGFNSENIERGHASDFHLFEDTQELAPKS